MTRTQVQLPDELYRRAKRYAAEREMSLAEMTRRGLEMLLERYPEAPTPAAKWKLPRVEVGRLKIRLEDLSDFLADEEANRSLTRR